MQPRVGTEPVVNLRSDVFWVAERVLGIYIKGPCSLDSNDAEEMFMAFDQLGVVAPTALIADIRTLRGVSLGLRTHMSSERAGRYMARVALVADNPLTRTLGNFFMRLNRPPFPLRIFDGEDEALRWLATHSGET
ncbi:MAG TPA: STAS/SEC14 domain-containing protein [Polyangiaceae bacterium]|nr:STAS/SEC14 domain-containing protein [Polyangiaceae bacterium]